MSNLFFGNLGKDAKEVAVIMAGGQGTRFWPLSRKAQPKQFLSLAQNSQTLLEATVKRFPRFQSKQAVIVVAAHDMRELVQKHAPGVAVLVEPVPRNTATCIGYAAMKVLSVLGDIPIICLPSDHYIEGEEAFLETVYNALEIARQQDVLVCLGIEARYPDTAYGYIWAGKEARNLSGSAMTYFDVARFVEKPDVETAKRYVSSGEYYWNGGIFAFRPSVMLSAIAEFLPELSKQLEEIGKAFGKKDEFERAAELFSQIKPISIDFGVMEKTRHAVVLPARNFLWSDIGSWDAWAKCIAESPDETLVQGNISRGQTVLVDSKDCVVLANKKLVACVGLERIIVVESGDAVLVCNMDSAQGVKHVVDALKERGREDLL